MVSKENKMRGLQEFASSLRRGEVELLLQNFFIIRQTQLL
jgi:hypothetical protein